MTDYVQPYTLVRDFYMGFGSAAFKGEGWVVTIGEGSTAIMRDGGRQSWGRGQG